MAIRRHALSWLLLALAPCAQPAAAQDTAWEARAFWQQLDVQLEEVAPPALSEFVPGFDADAPIAAGLVVADLENDEGTAGDWGKVVGQILRWDLAYAHSPGLPVPDSYTYYQDAFVPGLARTDIGRADASVRRAAHRLGLDHTLTGRIGVRDEAFTLELSLRDLADDREVQSFQFSGALAQLPAALDEVPPRIYAALEAGPSTPRASRAAQTTVEQLRALVAALSVPADAQTEAVRQLWASGPRSVLAAVHTLWDLEADGPHAYLAQLDAVRAAFPQDRGLDWLVARMMQSRDGLLEEKRRRLVAHVLERPSDPMPMLVLADTLVDNGLALGGVTVAREALLRWPRNYRVWWSSSYALVHFGWELRGEGYWRDVPEVAQRLFPRMREAADHATDRALALHADNSGLWAHKMLTLGGYSDEFMQAYRRAIALEPKNRRAYELALNYSLPQWGGSREVQNEIWTEARKQINDPAWLERMRATYLTEETTLGQRLQGPAGVVLDLILSWEVMLSVLVVVVLVAVVIWGLQRRRAG
jgi:hypothetical protein